MRTKDKLEKYVKDHPLVELWLKGLAEGTKYNYTKAMILYTEYTGMTPQELLDLKENGGRKAERLLDIKEGGGRKAERLLDKFIAMVDMTEARKNIAVTAIHSFYKNNYLDLASRSGYSKLRYVAANDQKCPTQEELRDMTRNAHIRDDAIVNVASSGGFRRGTLIKLVWKDFEELWSWDGRSPIYVWIDSKRLKGEGYQGTVEQHCFMTRHAAEVLLRYAEWYKERRELTDDSPLFVSRGANQYNKVFNAMSEGSMWKAITALGKFSPHDLRRFAQTQLETARVNPNWIKKMQGKKLRGEDNPYSKPKIEAMRAAFMLAEPYLTLAPPTLSLDPIEQRKQAILDSAEMLYADDPKKLLEFKNLMQKVTTEQELKDAKSKWWNSRT